MANSIEVPVVLALNQAQEQIAQLRKALQEGMDPKSSEFKTIIRMIEQATNRAEHLKATMQSSFSTSSGAKKFSNEMQRTFDLINTIVGRMKNVDTKNLLFSEEDKEKINNIRTEIENTYKALTELKSGKIGTFFEGDIKEEFKNLGNLAKDLFSNLQKMSFTQLGEGLEKESKKVQENLDKIQEKIKSITSAQGKVSGDTNSDPFSILKTTTLTTVTPKVNRLIIDNLKNSLKQTFQEYNELFDIKSLTANLNKVTQKDVQQGSALTLQTDAIAAAVEEAINKLKSEKNKYQQALEELNNVQTSGFGRDANGNKVSSRAAQAARENAANQARNIVQKLGMEAPEREDFEFVSKYVERLRTKVEEESTKFIQESEENLKQKGEQLKGTVSNVFKTSLSEFEINDSKGFQARVKEWLLGDLKLPEIGQELNNAISQMTKGTNVQEAFSILGNALKNSLNNSLEQLGNEETEAKVKAEALTKAMTDLGLIAQDNKGKIDLNEKSLADMQKRLEELLGQKLADFTKTIPIIDPKQTYEAENALTQYINRLKELETRQKSLSNVQMAVKQWMGFYQVLNLGKKAITDMKNHIQELDSVMTQIAVVTNMSQGDLWNQIGQYSQIARQYGVAIKGVYEVSQIYYQQGLEQNDVMTLTTETLKMARIAGLDYATAADYMTTAIRGFKLEMSDASHVTDVYSALAATTASSTEELAVAISKTASSAEAVGASFEATSAMMATMIATTRESATNIGTALKSVISRYGEMTKDPSKLVDSEGEEMSLNRVDTALQTIGISIHDVNGQFRDFDDVILELGKKWNTIDKNAQRYIATLMAGNRQQSRFLALVSNIDEYEKALATAQNAEGTGEVQTLKTLDSIDARLEKMKVTIQEFYTSSGLEDLYKGVLDIITNIFDAANHLPKLFDKIPVTALAVGGMIINVIKKVLSLIVAEISAAMDTAKNNIDLTITKRIAQAKEDGRQIGIARKKGEIEGEQEVTTGTSVKTGIGKQLGSIAARTGGAIFSAVGAGLTISGLNQYGSSLTKEQDRAAGASTLFGGILGIGGSALTGLATGGPIGAAIGAVTGLISNIGTLTSSFSMLNVSTARQIELADKRLEKAKQEEAVSKNEVKNLETAYNKLIELEKHRYDSVEDAKAYAEYMNQLGDTYPKFIETLSTSGDVIISVTAMEEELGRVRATALENTIKTVKSEEEALQLRQEVNKKFLEQIEDFSFSENLKNPLKNFMDKVDPKGMYNEDTLFDWIKQYLDDINYEAEKNSLVKNFIENYSKGNLTEELSPEEIEKFYKDAWEVLQIKEENISLVEGFKGYLSDPRFSILSHIRSQIIDAINSYISIPENKDFLKQFEGLENVQNPISEIENWSIEKILNLSNQIYTYIDSVVNSTDKALENLGTQINSAEASAEVQKRINDLLEKKGTEDSGKKLQSYFKLMTSLLGTKDAVEKQFEELGGLILRDTTTADKLMNLDYSQFSSADSIINSLPNEWKVYEETIRKNFDVIRNSAVKGMKDQIEELKNLDITKIISFEDNDTFNSNLITQLIPSLREGLSQYQKLLDKGLFSDARIYGEGLGNFFTLISSISDEAQLKISSIVREIDFSDSESLRSAAEKLKAINFVDNKDKKVVQEAAENLEGAAKQYIINISTLLMQLKENTTDTAKALETAFDNQTKALSRSEAMKAAEELLKGYTGSNSNLSWDKLYEYNSELGGYVANQTALEIAITKATEEATTKLKDINNQITNYNSLIKFFGGVEKLGTALTQYLGATDEDKASFRKSQIQSLNKQKLNGAQLMGLFDQMAQQAKGYESVDQYLEEYATEGAEQVAEAQKEIDFATQQAAIDWLRKQKYENIAGGNYTQTDEQNIKTALNKVFKGKVDTANFNNIFKELWNYIINGEFDKFEQSLTGHLENYEINVDGNIISDLLFPKGQEAELKQQQTALSEVLSEISYEQMSQATKEIVEPNYNIENALNEAEKILAKIKITSGGDTSKEYKKASAQVWEFAQSQDKAASLMNQIRDGQISTTEDIFHKLIDGSKNLTEEAQKYFEIDKEKGGLKLKKNVSLLQAFTGLAESWNITIDETSQSYNDFVSESIEQQIKDLDANDASKQVLSQLQTLSSAKVGTRVAVDKIPTEIIEKLGISAVDGIYQIQSEFQTQAAIMALSENDFDDAESKQWIRQYKQEIESKKSIQQQALQNIIASSFSMDQAKSYLKSVYQSIDWDSFSDEGIITQMKTEGFNWDPFTKSFTNTIESIDKINSIIQDYAEQGLATPEDINNLKAMLSQLEYQIGNGRKYSSLSNIIENSEAVSDEMIAELKTAYDNLSDSQISSIFGTKRSNGTFKANVALLLKIIGGGFTDLANKASDAYINNIQSILSMVSNGTTSIDEMSKFAETFGVDAKTAFDYDNDLGAWKLDASQLKPLIEKQAEELRKNGLLTEEDIDSWVKKQIDSITVDQIDIQGILSAGTEKDRNKYKNILVDYYKTNSRKYGRFGISEQIEKWAKEEAENAFNIIHQGGQAAVDKIKEIKGDNATTEDIEAAYNYYSDLVISAMDLLEGDIVGKFVTDRQKLLLAGNNIKINDNNMIESVEDLVAAYESLYEAMKQNNNGSTSKLNTAYAKVLSAKERGEAEAINALSNAMGMSYEELGTLLANYDVSLETVMENLQGLGLEKIGAGKVRIKDFNTFAAQMGWDFSSEEYTSAFKTYNDSLIALNKKAEKEIGEEVKAISSAKGGDKLNLTKFYDKLVKSVDNKFQNLNGNVDLLKRPVISAQQMRDAEYSDFEDGSYATLYSSSYLDRDIGALFTPITKLGEVLSQDELNNYVDSILNQYDGTVESLIKIDKNSKQLMIHAQEFDNDNEQFIDNYMSNLGKRVSQEQAQIPINKLNEELLNYGAQLQNGILELSDNANITAVLSTIAQTAEEGGYLLAEDVAEIKDAIDEALNTFTESLSKGIKGTLTNAETQNLKSFAKNTFNIEIKFQQGANGLKIAKQDAILLYGELSKIDEKAAKITFEAFKESLEQSGEACENITRTMANIKRIQQEINRISQFGKDKEQEKIPILERELEIYQDIERAQMSDPSKYDFMNRSLPDVYQAPANYMTSIGQMFKALNTSVATYKQNLEEAKENGWDTSDIGLYLGVQDYYNIVTEMGDLAKLTGKELKFMGETITDDVLQVADVIQKGFNSAKIDPESGQLVVDFTEWGLNVVNSGGNGASMISGFKQAKDEWAKAQLEMVDELISVLEVVVKMGEIQEKFELDSNEDNVIDLGEFTRVIEWNKDSKGINFKDPEFKDWLDELAEIDENSPLGKGLDKFIVNNEKFRDLLKRATKNQLKTENEYLVFMNALSAFTATAANPDWNPEDVNTVYDSFIQALKNSSFEGDVPIGNTTYSFKEGYVFQKVGEGYIYKGQEFSSFDQAKAAILLDQEKNTIGIAKVDESNSEIVSKDLFIEGLQNLKVQRNIVTGEVSYVYNGTPYNTKEKALREAFKATEEGSKLFNQGPEEFEKAFKEKFNIYLTPDYDVKVDGIDDAELYNKISNALKELNGSDAKEKVQNAIEEAKNKGLNKENKYTVKIAGIDIEVDDISQVNVNGIQEAMEEKLGTTLVGQISGGVAKAFSSTEVQTALSKAVTTGIQNLFGDDSVNATDISTIPLPELSVQPKKVSVNLQPGTQPTWADGIEPTFEPLVLENALSIMATALTNLDVTPIQQAAVAMESLAKSATTLANVNWGVISGGTGSINTPATPGNSLDSSNTTPQIDGVSKAINSVVKLSYDNKKAEEIVNKNEIERNVKLTADSSLIQKSLENLSANVNLNTGVNPISTATPTPSSGTTETKDIKFNTGSVDVLQATVNAALQQINSVAKAAQDIKSDEVLGIKKAEESIGTEKIQEIKTIAGSINSSPIMRVAGTAASISSKGIDAVKSALDSLHGSASIDLAVQVSISSDGDGSATGNVTNAQINVGEVKSIGGNSASFSISKSYAKGTKKTLMGELGPELVVSNGRYFIVGQNGAEMVDLAPDAIVFNHLQTKRLLTNGTSGRGKPLTNERTAVSFATGNVTGPAMASAKEALATLKSLRGLLAGMLEASMKDLGSSAGQLKNKSNKSGGGSNQNDNYKKAIDNGIIADLERWYNLLRQIKLIEQDINYEEKLRQKILGDLISNGNEIYESQKRQLEALQDTIVKQEELSFLQKSYYEDMRKALDKSAYGQLFTFTEEGMMQYKEGGFEFLSELNSVLPNGAPKYTAEQQYNMLLSWGFGNEMLYDTSGKKIERYEEKTSTDDFGNEITSKEAREGFFSDSVQTFWDKIDNWKNDLDELFDTYTQTQNDLLDAETKRNEILKAIQENQLNLENQVLDAIEHQREEVIENLEKEKDAIDKTTKAYIDGLNKQLEQEKKLYQKQKSDEELNKARRQLGILQRSGGSASQIESLKQQIAGMEQTAYFDKQQEQIDAVQEASNKEIERLDAIIDTEKEALEYQKAQGLLWGQVAEIMAGTPGEITNFITQNTPDIIKLSTAGMEAKIEEIRNVVTQWIAKRDDTDDIVGQDRIDSAGQSWEAWYAENVNKDYTSQAWTDMYDEVKKAFIDAYVETSDISRAANAARDVLGSVSSNYRSDDYSYDNNFTNKNRGGTSNQNIITKDDLLGIYIDSLGKLHEKTEDGYDHILYDIRMNPYTLSSLKADRDTFEDFKTSTYAHQSMSYKRYLKLIEDLKQYNNLTDSDNFVQEILEEDVSRTVSNGNSNNNSTYYSSSTKEENDTFQGTGNESSTKNNEELQLSGYKYDDKKHWQEDQYGKKHNEGLHDRKVSKYYGSSLCDYCSVCNRYMGEHVAQTVTNTIASTSVTNNTSDNKTNQSSNTNKAAMDRAERILNSTADKVTPEKREERINALIQEGNLTEEDQKKLKQMIKDAKSNGKLPSYSSGGKVNFTGPAILHGSKTRPEWILNADETKMWKEDILSGRPGSLTYGIAQLQNMINGMVLGNSTNSSTDNNYNGTIIEKVELIMNANIANDYDARRAGSNVMDEIIQIARKTGMNGVRR